MSRGSLPLLVAVAIVAAIAWLCFRPVSPEPVPDIGMLGAHVLVGQEDKVAAPLAQTPPLHTAAKGSSLVAFVAGYASNDVAPGDNFGNQWRRIAAPVVYRGYQDRFDLGAYLVEDARGGANHVVRVEKPGRPNGELTLVVVEVRNAGKLLGAVQAYPKSGFRLSSAEVTTDGPALLLAVWWGDSDSLDHHVEPDSGFRVIDRFTRLPPHSAVQAVVAAREVEHAGRYRVNWYNVPRQGAILWLLAFAPANTSPSLHPPAGDNAGDTARTTKR